MVSATTDTEVKLLLRKIKSDLEKEECLILQE